MRHRTLATDYDGTLATYGKVDEQTLSSLRRFLLSGHKLVLITGREPNIAQFTDQGSRPTVDVLLFYNRAHAPHPVLSLNRIHRQRVKIASAKSLAQSKCLLVPANHPGGITKLVRALGECLYLPVHRRELLQLRLEYPKQTAESSRYRAARSTRNNFILAASFY
jgi:hypothetical protein